MKNKKRKTTAETRQDKYERCQGYINFLRKDLSAEMSYQKAMDTRFMIAALLAVELFSTKKQYDVWEEVKPKLLELMDDETKKLIEQNDIKF